MDDSGEMMSIDEVRECLREVRECRLNEDANWNNRSVQTYEHYIGHYMAKNLYFLQCRLLRRVGGRGQDEGVAAVASGNARSLRCLLFVQARRA